MNNPCEDIQALMSGQLDGELEPDETKRLEKHLASCTECQAEFEKMKQLVAATSKLRFAEPPDDVWDHFLEGVYNRLERKMGWLVFIIGAVVLAAFGIYAFVTEPWGSAFVKVIIAAPIVGLAIVFVSVLRHRLHVAKNDRYSKEVHW